MQLVALPLLVTHAIKPILAIIISKSTHSHPASARVITYNSMCLNDLRLLLHSVYSVSVDSLDIYTTVENGFTLYIIIL